jgi:general secretion pathway protein K
VGFSNHDERLSAMIGNSALGSQRSALFNERGVALVVVLWIFIFLFAVATDFAASVREEGTAAHRYAEETEGYYLALAGFQQGLYELLKQSSQPKQVNPQKSIDLFDKDCLEGSLGDGLYRVCLIDEGSKINLNRTDEATLRRIFTNMGVEEPQGGILVDSILDWIDDDDLHRTNGAESDYYLSLSPPYTAKNGPFDAIEELLWVRGVTPELFYGQNEGGEREEDGMRRVGLREIFTVNNFTDRVNLRTASAEVIHALTGLPLKKCQEFVEQRKKLSEKTLADMLKILGISAGDAVLQKFVFANPSVVTIEAAGRHKDSVTERWVAGVVQVAGGQRGFQLIRWIDRQMGVHQWKQG